mgnify:FL=1
MSSLCPNLSKLPLRTDVYPEDDRAWYDRTELVLGGCKPDEGNRQATECYDDWSAALIKRVFENPHANTVVLLSVGAGVLELNTLKLIMDIRGDGDTAIDQVWLIDPGLPRDTGDQVASQYAAHLENVSVSYFTGDDAYTDAVGVLQNDESRVVAAVGALNFSFGLMGTHEGYRRLNIAPRNLLEKALERNPKLYIVRAWRDSVRRQYVVLGDETAQEFLFHQRNYTRRFEELMWNEPIPEELIDRRHRESRP